MLRILASGLLIAGALVPSFSTLPFTPTYELNSFGFGSGGTANSTTGNYTLEGITGEVSGQPAVTPTYADNSGFIQTQQSNVPKITLTNPASYYDKLKFVIDTQNNPSDALYALQVCVGADFLPNCGGTTMYVQNDDTLGSTLTISDYQTYTAWGGAGGANLIGLTASTNYYIRAKATHFKVNTNKITTESAYGPSSGAATVGQSISFCLYTSGSCLGGGNTIAFGGVLANTITNSPSNIGTDFSTNADNGGNVYIYAKNGSLKSTSTGYTITSATTDLSVASQGFGAQITSVGQGSGGPLAASSPYNVTGTNVGILATTVNTLLTSAAPITSGVAVTQLKVKPAYIAPPVSDYSETLTVVAAAGF